ncbi:STAS domain-containing protein [Desulfallas sp. Bu1-1]|uniref:STAS domain-containing protein n=1 Tax=Desulfallas sp. Bu1-1 TaxID=2787620 RepID=UPI00189CEF81|nr:STAS domain-containing protein [Desulfallas sp. Bu1-1]MBF7084015.1 STAS domain-containing protein [Desulfallas sp. Bu1-1]
MLNVKSRLEGKTVRLSLEGVLDISTVDTFNSQTEQLSGISELVLDMAGLEFIDSSGIGAILQVVRLSQERGFTVNLENANENISELLNTVGLFQIIEALQKGAN